MLVLTRKPGERIQIGENIWVEVRRVAGNRVTLAIDAPKDVHILRGELEPFAREFTGEEPSEAGAYRVEHYRIHRDGARASGRPQPAAV